MFTRSITWDLVLVGALVLAQPAIVYAQNMQGTPARIDNIWDGLAHQPTRAEVTPLEQQAGIAPSNPQNLNQKLAQLDHQLLSEASTHVPTDIASSTGRGI
jgi:hypothetical protein